MIPEWSPDRRQFLIGVGRMALPAVEGCLADEEEDHISDSLISVRNNSAEDRECAFIVHNEITDERLVEEVATVPADERRRIEFTAEGVDDAPSVWVMVRLDELDDFDAFDSINGPSNYTVGEEPPNRPDSLDDRYVGTESGKLTPGGVSSFNGTIDESGEISLGITQV